MFNLKKNSPRQRREAGQPQKSLLATLTLATGLLFFGGGASAATLDLTQVASSGNGGPFEVTDIVGGPLSGQADFITFCVEQQEHVNRTNNDLTYALSTDVKYRGTGSTTQTATRLNSKTAQLYSMFRDGSLATQTSFDNSDAHKVQLQHAIWNTEGYSSPTLGALAQELVDYVSGTNAWTLDLGNVRVINLTSNGVYKQDQLAIVPIPAAAWLFGSGLIGLAAITRKKKKA